MDGTLKNTGQVKFLTCPVFFVRKSSGVPEIVNSYQYLLSELLLKVGSGTEACEGL
jgi:hypothetical protein